MKEMEIKLKENNEIIEIIEINNVEFKGINPINFDTTDINNRNELINYLKIKNDEERGIEIAIPKLKELNIEIKSLPSSRFEHFDAIATSASTNTNEEILLEFKFRTGTTSDQYDSFILDSKKCRALLNEHHNSNRRIFIVNIFSDKKIRVFEFSKYYRNYCNVKVCNVIDAKYRVNVLKEKKLIEYSNSLTILL